MENFFGAFLFNENFLINFLCTYKYKYESNWRFFIQISQYLPFHNIFEVSILDLGKFSVWNNREHVSIIWAFFQISIIISVI